jgi:hypothetical protein
MKQINVKAAMLTAHNQQISMVQAETQFDWATAAALLSFRIWLGTRRAIKNMLDI